MIERENDPIAGILNGIGFAFILWGIIFLSVAIVRWIF